MQRFDFIAIAKGEKAGLRAGAFIERQDEGTIETGSVIGAGGVTKMVIEAGEARTSTQELQKAIEGRGMRGTLFAGAGRFAGEAAIGETHSATIGKLQAVFEQTTIEGKTRNFTGIVEAIEFFFLNGKNKTLFVEERYGGAVTQSGDPEKVHARFDQPAPSAPANASCGRDANKFLPSKAVIVRVKNWLGSRAAGISTVS